MEKRLITIDTERIIGKVRQESALLAKARSATGTPDALADIFPVTSDETSITEKHIAEKLNGVTGYIGNYLPACHLTAREENGKKEYTIVLVAPHNYPTGNIEKLRNSIEEIVFYGVMQEWALLIKPDEANIHSTKTGEATVRLRRLLAERKRPTRGKQSKENIVDL